MTAPSFCVSRLARLFDASRFVLDAFHHSYEVAPNARSFIFIAPRRAGATAGPPKLEWVDHWFDDLRARVKP